MPGQNLTKTLKSLEGKVESALIGIYKNAHIDELPNWCNVKIVDCDFDKWRNQNTNKQTLIIHPGEELISDLSIEQKKYRVYVMDESSVSKETRIIMPADGKFVNPIYECFDTQQTPELINIIIKPSEQNINMELLDEWIKKEPESCEADYYKAFALLTAKKYNEFIRKAEYFLFRTGQKHRSSIIMIKYYLGVILLSLGQPNKAASYFLSGLQEEPMMAEFWCGLGDCFRKTGQPNKAIRMYKNAIIMGAKRNATDTLPIILTMYESYPNSMLK